MANDDKFEVNELPVANIVVAGITGAGKSTLVNAVFGSEDAETGTGKAVTDHMEEYHPNGAPVCIWDTVGLELDAAKTEQSIRDIRKKIEEKAVGGNERECIHAIWYCINTGSNRFQSAEVTFIKRLHSLGVPFIIVLTQCQDIQSKIDLFEKAVRDEINEHGMSDIDIVQICAKNYETRLGVIESFGLDRLVQLTTDKMPDFLTTSFLAAQNVCKENKRAECEKIILTYVKKAMDGFWDNLWILNSIETNRKVKMLLVEIARMYNPILKEDALNEKVAELHLNAEAIFKGLILPWKGKYGKRMQSMFESKVGGGYEGDFCDLPESARSARLIAFYGCLFIDSVEATWKWQNEQKVNDIKEFVDELVKNINKHLDEMKREHSLNTI